MSKLMTNLESELAGIILRYATRKRGDLTMVSDISSINRREFNVDGISNMKLFRLGRLLSAIKSMSDKGYKQMMDEIEAVIDKYLSDSQGILPDE